MIKWQTVLDLAIMMSIALLLLTFAVIAKKSNTAESKYRMLVETVKRDEKELQAFLQEHPEFSNQKTEKN